MVEELMYLPEFIVPKKKMCPVIPVGMMVLHTSHSVATLLLVWDYLQTNVCYFECLYDWSSKIMLDQ
jgi:hypothetical protein